MMHYKSWHAIVALLLCCFSFGQTSWTTTVTRPNSSEAGLMSYSDVPVNLNTGTPNVSIPFFSLPTHEPEVSISAQLSYHPNNASVSALSSNVGLGWNLNLGGSISRTVINSPDEEVVKYYVSNNKPLEEVIYDDYYSYNFMGKSGNFKIVFDGANNTYELVKFDIDNLKIDFQINPENKNIESFTITDGSGIKYLFDVKDREVKKAYQVESPISRRGGTYSPPSSYLPESYLQTNFVFYNTYHLTNIKDAYDNELANFEYVLHRKVFQTYTQAPNFDILKNRLVNVYAVDFGKISLDSEYNVNDEVKNIDVFKINQISLYDAKNQLVDRYSFNFSQQQFNPYVGGNDVIYKRFLTRLDHFAQTTTNPKSYVFSYKSMSNLPNNANLCFQGNFGTDKFGFLNEEYGLNTMQVDFIDLVLGPKKRTSKNQVTYGSLSKITYPNGLETTFEFESNTYSLIDYPNSEPIEEYKRENLDNIVFQEIFYENFQNSQTNLYPLTVTNSGVASLYVNFELTAYSDQISSNQDPSLITMRIIGNGVNITVPQSYTSCLGRYVEIPPGNYTMQINAPLGAVFSGKIVVTKRNVKQGPLNNWLYGGGIRIKEMRYLDPANNSERIVTYNYQKFSDASYSSGEVYEAYLTNYVTNQHAYMQISYRNVEVVDSFKPGKIRYQYYSYFDAPDLFTDYYLSEPHFEDYYAYKNGLLKKVEYFTANNELQKSEEMSYQFLRNNRGFYPFVHANLIFQFFTTDPSVALLKNKKVTELFLNTTPVTSIITDEEFTYNTNSYNYVNLLPIESSRSVIKVQGTNSTLFDTSRTKYEFSSADSASNPLYFQFLNRNIVLKPILSETYKDQSFLTRQQNYYTQDSAGKILLSHETARKDQGAEETVQAVTKYNNRNKILEYKTRNSNTTSFIYGYQSTLPVAKIENLAYDNIPAQLITDIQNASNTGTEAQLLTALTALRNHSALANAMVTTYTHKPLIGVSTITDPKGDRQTFHYDPFNRLQFVKDKDGNILSENEYHYRTQN